MKKSFDATLETAYDCGNLFGLPIVAYRCLEFLERESGTFYA